MNFDVYLLSILFTALFLLTILGLVRKRQLKEQYSLMWILVAALMFLFSLSKNLLELMAARLDIQYAPSMLFLFGLVFAFTLTLHLTVVVSRQSEQLVHLAQELALLRQEVQRSNQSLQGSAGSGKKEKQLPDSCP